MKNALHPGAPTAATPAPDTSAAAAAPAYAAPAPAFAPSAGGGGGAYDTTDYDDGTGGYSPAVDYGMDAGGDDDEDLPFVPSSGDDGGDREELADIDYARYFGPGEPINFGGLGDWTDDLKKIGVDLGKGAASGILTSAAKALTSSPAKPATPPPPPPMSVTAKIAIGAAIGVPVLYLLTRRRGSAPAAAAPAVAHNPRRRRRRRR